jgi:hypothetical protein
MPLRIYIMYYKTLCNQFLRKHTPATSKLVHAKKQNHHDPRLMIGGGLSGSNLVTPKSGLLNILIKAALLATSVPFLRAITSCS